MSFRDMKSVEERKRLREPHAIWRGIGIALIVLIPIVSIAIADQLIRYLWETMPGFTIPKGFLRTPLVIDQLGISIANFPAVIAFAVVIGIALFGLFSIVSAIIYRLTRNKNRYVFESEPVCYKKKKKLKKPKYK